MDRPHRESRQRNGITVRHLPQPTFATKSARSWHDSLARQRPLWEVKRTWVKAHQTTVGNQLPMQVVFPDHPVRPTQCPLCPDSD